MKVKKVLTILPVALLLGLGVVGTLAPQQAYAASSTVDDYLPSTGRDFWLTFMQNADAETADNVKLKLEVIAIPTASGTISLTCGDGTPLVTGGSLSAGTPYVYEIPADKRDKVYNTSSATKTSKGLHVETTGTDIALYVRSKYVNSQALNSYDMSPVFPIKTLGADYVIQSYWEDQTNTVMAVVATENDTKITIKPSCKTLNSDNTTWSAAGTTRTETLNKGQVYLLKGESFAEDEPYTNIAGTTVGASKPVAVFNGGVIAFIPDGTGLSGDHIFEQALPVHAWGKRFVLMNMNAFPTGVYEKSSSPTEFIITAIYPDTKVYVDGEYLLTLQPGESTPTYDESTTISVAWDGTPKMVQTSEPVSISGFMVNAQHNTYRNTPSAPKGIGIGEPSMVLIPDVTKGVSEMSYYCKDVNTGATTEHLNTHYANVIVTKSGVAGMRLHNGTEVVNISGNFSTCSQPFDGMSEEYAYARIQLTDDKLNRLYNENDIPFVATMYSVLPGQAMSEAAVATMNIVPSAPVMFVDDNEVVHGSTFDYCNKHPGVHFTAIVDYPHTGVKWELGEGAVSTDYEASHMYGATVGESDKKHDVYLYVFHETPITHVKDTDTVHVTLNVHPVYYDTLKTKVAANKMVYEWKTSSEVPFGLIDGGSPKYAQITLSQTEDLEGRKPWIKYEKDSANAAAWTDSHADFQIFDSLVYATRHDCDSIFYLQLDVVPDIIMPEENASICQGESFTWTGHHNAWNHLTQDGVAITTINTATAGTFVIRDTMQSLVFPYPDSIHILNLTVYDKPTIKVADDHRKDLICEVNQPTWTVPYVANYADSLHYWLKPDSAYDATRREAGLRRTTETSFDISTMSSLPDGKYKLILQAFNTTTGCISKTDTVPLVIKNRPSLKVDNVDPQCWDETAPTFTFSYTPVDAAKITYWVDSVGGTPHKIASTTIAVDATKKFDIATTGWPAGHYELYAQPVSALGCDSTAVKVEFVINKKPTITITSTSDELSQCDKEDATTLKFNVKDANNYNYYIVGKTSLLATPVAVTDGDKEISLDISSISDLTADTEFTLKMVANSATCVSDTAEKKFTVYPMPTATITSLPADLNSCAPGTSNKTVNYTTTNASQIKWQLTTPHGVMNYDYAAVGSSLTVLQDSLVCPGTYKVKITGVKSAAPMNCEVLNPAGGEVTFTMYNPAAITLNDIAAVCAGNAVTSTYTAEYTDSYTYEVRRKTGNVLKGSGSSTTINGTIDLSKTDTLPAGTYVLSVTATNTNNCGSSSASKEFVINPIPVINSLSTPDNVCETEVASRDVSFTATDAANILYTLKKGATVWNAENSVAVGAGKFSIKTDTLSAGDYTVEAKSVSGAGCTGAVKSVNFTVYPHPTVTLPASLPNACFGEESLTINYSTTYASTYAYTLADKDGNALTPGSGAAVASGSIVVPLTATMTAAKSPYKFRIEVTSDKGCKSGWVEKTFTIYPKPTAGITSVESKCDNETSAAVVYTSANATKYEYRVFKSGVAAPVLTVTDQDVTGTTFNVDISTLDAGSYELRLVAKSATCESDTAKKSFDIWPLPVISTLANTTPCEGESVVNVPYTATNASKFSYTVKDGETVVKTVATATVADGKIEVDIDGLTTGGAVTKPYTLSVTAKSEHDCETAAAKTATITLKAKPTVTLSSVTNTCAGAGAAITIAYTGLTANKLDYIVRKGGVDTSVSGTKTGLTPGVDGSFDISGATFEALAAGTDYEVEIIAQGDNGCPSVGVDQVKAFTIYPLPTVSVKSGYESVTVCEGREDAVFELTTSDNASTYSYESGALGLTATDQPVVDKKIKITLSKADLKDGDFTLTVTVKSAAPQSCTSVAATATLHVNNRPTLKIDDIAAKCYPISSFTVSYTPTDAKYVKWTVDNKITTEQTHTVPNAAPYQFTISTDGWAAGTYTLRAKPVSALDCDSAAVVKTFTINAKPELSNLHAYNECTNQFVNVFFDHNGVGNRIEWEVLGTTCHGEEDIAGASSGVAHIEPNSLPAGDYTFRGKMVNTTTGCESEPKDLNFTLWPRAEISLLKDSAFCYPADKSYVRYAATNAASYTYRLTGHGIDSYLSGSGTMTFAGLIEVNTNGLEGGYAYTLTVTAASEHDCKSDEKTATITLYPQPAITSLAKVDSVCEKHSPSAIALTMTGATKYNYEVLKDGESTPKEQKTGETASSITLNTNAWAAGKYTLKVTAVSDLNCGSAVEERVFLIYPQPKVTALSDVTICETDAEALFSYTMTDAKTYTYDLKNSLDVTVASSATAQTASSSGSIKINSAELPDGTYTLHVTATSDKGCVSDEKTSTLTINNQPSVNMSAPAAQCHPASLFEVTYAPEDVKTFTYTVKQGSTTKKSAETITPTTAPYKFSFSTTGWAAGTYTIEAKAVSADNCDGKTETVNFTINKKPVISDLTTQNKCKGDAIQVSFNHDNVANGCNWEIVETGVTGSKAFTHDSPDGFPIATSAMDPGTYTLRVWVSNSTTTCTSEYAEKTFTVYPIPTLTVHDTTAIYPQTTIYVRYTATDAAGGTYTYTLNGAGIDPSDPRTGDGSAANSGWISVGTNGLNPGVYNLSVTVTSANGCTKTDDATITIYDPTTIDEPVAEDDCKGSTDPIEVNIHTTYADKYSYEVVVKGTTTHPVDNYAGSATFTNTGDVPVDNTISIDVSNWAPAVYTITVKAENTVTHAEKTKSADFEIYAIPVLTFTDHAAICEGAETTVEILHSTENIESVEYKVEKNGSAYAAATWTAAAGKVILNVDEWENATYTIYGKPTSSHGCVGEWAQTDLVVYNQPEATITAMPANICAGEGYLNVEFSDATADARTYAFRILNASDQPVSGYAGSGNITTPGSGSYAVDVHTLPVGSYKMELKTKTKTEESCWSKLEIKPFSVRDTFLFITRDTICKKETYTWNYGGIHSEDVVGTDLGAGVHVIDRNYPTATYGCDSIYRLILTIGEEYEIVENKTVCENKPFSWRGLDFTGREDGTYDDIHTDSLTVLGCDSIFKLHLTVEDSPAPLQTNAHICYGEKFDWIVTDCEGHKVTLMKGLTESTHQVDTLICSDPNECNPIYELNLTIWPEYSKDDAPVHLCAGDAYVWRGGKTLTEAGEYEYRKEGVAANGCDSIYRITVTKLVPEQKTIAQTVCYGEPVIFNGHEYKDLPVGKQMLSETIKSVGGCDSVYLTLDLTVGQRYYDSIVVTECDSYKWAVTGLTYSESGIYREQLATVNGCDSVFVLNLTINKSYSFNETYDILTKQLPFTVHEYTFEQAGTFDREFKSIAGCDSIYHITLNVHEEPLPKDTTVATICEGATHTWQGIDYSKEGWYSVTENDGTQDVAIHVLHLIVNEKYSHTSYVHHCGANYLWDVDGNTYDASGTYTWAGHSLVTGCDSTEILVLTLGKDNTGAEAVTACQYEPVAIGNRSFIAMENTSFDETLTNASGCDSVVTYTVTVTPRNYTAVETPDDYCEGTTYAWRGHTYETAGIYYDTTKAGGCATEIHTLNLVSQPYYRFDEDIEVWEDALPYAWVGHKADTLLSTDGDYYDRQTTISGCDSTYHIHFHVNWVTRDTVSKEGCESVTWNIDNKTYTYSESGLYSDTAFIGDPANKKYEEVHFCKVTVYPAYHVTEPDVTICESALPYIFHDEELTGLTVGDNEPRTINPKTIHGCDSTFTVAVHVVKSFNKAEELTVCPGELPYIWHGQSLSADGDYTDVRPSPTGCDSTYTMHLTVNTQVTKPDTLDDDICLGKTYKWMRGDEQLMAIEGIALGTHSYYKWYTVPGECDSTYHMLNLTVKAPNEPILTDTVICYGETFNWIVPGCDGVTPVTLMKGLTETTHQIDTLICETNECNPIYELKLEVLPEYAAEDEPRMLCFNESFMWRGGQVIDKAGTYEYVAENAADVYGNGKMFCDSVYRITVDQLIPEYKEPISQSVCYGETVIFNGHEYKDLPVGKQTLSETIKSVGGCDSVYLTLDLTVGQRYYDSIPVIACDKYVWEAVNGNTYTHSGIYREEYSTIDGCDSIFVLNLTINESYEFYESYDVLETELPFTVHEYSYTAAGTYDRKFTSVGGCDSIYHITLNVYPFILPKDTTEATICADAAPYNWQGNAYSATGWYSVTENDGTQDVAIHYLHLTVNKTNSDTVYVHACDSYTWDKNGTIYTASTEDKVQLTSTCNCDSTIVLKLTIGNANSSTVDVTACQYEPIAVGNRSFVAMENTSFTETKTNASGCDSVITYNVTVTPREYVTPAINDAFCEGTPYVWDNTAEGGQSHTYLVAGTYYDTIADANGCATKIFTLELSAKPQYRIDEDVEVSELALPYAWRGHKGDTLLRTNGDYYDIYPATADRCDSVHHIHFHVNFVDRDTLHLTGCDSVKWDVTGEWYKTTCLVSDTVFLNDEKTLYDEIHFCDVTVNYSFEEIEPDVTICQSDAFTWHGTDYEANHFSAGDHELATDDKSVAECDSIYKVTLHVVESFRDEKTYEACPNELPYLWRGQLLTVDGDYTDVRPSPTGCDSTYIMHFTVNTHVTEPSTEHQTICQDAENPLPWQDLTIPIHTPGEYTYYHWYTVPGECDETYHRLDLTVNRSEQVGGYDTAHICYKDSYMWHGDARTVPETAATLQPDGTYATDIDAYKQNILGCDSLDAHLHLVMHTPSAAILEDTTICNEYLWIDTLINTTGTYTKAFTTVYGCKDSTLTRHFDVYYSKTDTLDSVFACDYYRWKGQDFTEVGDTLAEYHVQQLGGTCDSIVYLPLTLHKTVRDTAKLDWWCTEFAWGETEQTYTSSGVYAGNPHKLASGCDSIPYLYLTLHDSIVEHIYDTACVTYSWDLNHMTYTGSTVDRYVEKAVTGCDSAVHWLHLTIHQPSPVTFDTLDACRSYIHKDIEYRDTTDLVLELKTIHGCDSIVRLHVNVTQPDTIYDTIRTCNIYEREGHTYLYSCDTVHEYACDSVVMLNITIDLDRDSDIWVTRWDSYEWEGDTYTESGEYKKTLQTVVGHCDSTVTLHLIINDSKDTVEKQIACESFKWEWNDSTYLLSTIDTVTLRIDEGLETERDSTRILELGIGHKKFNAFTETACDFFNWHGVQYFESQTVEYSYTDTCEGNVDTLHLTIFHKVEVEHFDTACDVLTVQGESFFRDTTFTQQLHTINGCDSIVNYHLIISHRQTRNISVMACGDYTWEGTTYTKSGVYTRVLTGSNGCDSVVTLNLSVRPSYHTEFDAVGCNGYYVWGNRIFDVAGDYDSIYTLEGRCDSVVTMHLTLPETIQGPWAMDTACDEFWWNGQRYTETGYYYETFTSSTGCDSIARLDLTIADNPRNTITETAQSKFTWGSQTYYETGLYEQRFKSETGYGCDSIVTLDLTITNPLPINQIADTACDAYTWDAETFYESGVYTRNFLTPEGNDSIVKLSLVINHDVAVSDSMQLCDSVEWNGVMYYESGVYTQVLQTVAGCDSVVTMTLTVCRRDSSVFTATARDVYTWDGVDYTESGTYQRTYTSSTGCDSIVTMMLTIIHNVHVELSDTACTEYAWADSIYTHSTIHTHIFTADNGSDSVVTMTLIIHEPVYTDQFDTVRVCDPEEPSYAEYYTLPWGEQVSHTGIYCDTLTSELSQCDSIVRFHLQWCDEELCLDTTTFVVNDQCESYEWEGQTYTTSGTYTRHHRLENGCDSIVIMRLDIKPKAQTVVDITDCDSLYWKDADLWIYETGFYYDTLLAANGCDSLVIMHAVVGHKGDSILDVETCDAYTINGKTYRETGTYIQELKTTTGCDSTLTINLIVNPSVDTVVADTACDSHLWNDKTLTETGFYPLVLQSALTGCDSVVDLHLIVYGSKQVSVIDSLHCDSIVWGDDYAGIDTIHDDGIYVKTFLSTVGCDSTVTMDLRLLRHDMITAPDTAACDSFVWNGKVYYESGTYSDTLTNSFTGCDSITTMYIEINPTIRVEIEDSVPPPFYLWPTENDTIWESGVYVDTTASLVTGCDSITTLNLIMTDSIILDPQEPVRVDTFGYCPGDTMNFVYNLLKGHPTKYILLFPDISVVQEIDPKRDFIQVTDTTELPNHGLDSLFTLVIPEQCEPKVYHAQLQLFDDFTSSEVYDFYIRVNYKGAIVSMWTDVVAINNFNEEFIGYQWYKDDVEIEGATKQYYSDGEDLYACYRAKLQLASDSSWIYTCEECFDLRSDSLELIAYPTPAPVGQPVTIKAMGILLEKLVGSTLTITKESGLKVDEFTLAEGQRSVDVTLTSGMYIATLVTGDADDRVRTANVKFIVF